MKERIDWKARALAAERDLADALQAMQTRFVRNPCGRLGEHGLICVCGKDHSA